MGCCPIFKKSIKVSELATSTIQQESPDNQMQFRGTNSVEPPTTIESGMPNSISNPTEGQMKCPEQIIQVQSNLEIALSASVQNDEREMQSEDMGPSVVPRFVLIGHSKIRESMIYRWQLPDFKVEELFLPINYDKLFKDQVNEQIPILLN